MIELEFLGTGTSSGVPVIGCDCDTCRSNDPHDTRLRASVVFHVGDVSLLVDTSPDLRYQALRANLRRVDALLYTHMHADHTAGIDDMRRFNALKQAWIPTYMPENAAKDLRERFAYAFRDDFPFFGMKPDLDLQTIVNAEPFDVAGVTVQPIPIMHGTLPILGYRIGDIAYLTDVKSIPHESMSLLQDLDSLVLTALRPVEHPAHMRLDEALAMVDQLKPNRAYFTHIGHDMGLHADVTSTLPANIHLAYDGLHVRQRERVAVVSDIHGNLTAFDAVLEDIRRRGIHRIINLGDLAGKGPRGAASIDRTRETCEVTVRGNWDEAFVQDRREFWPPMKWWYDELSTDDLEWLRNLPYAVDLELSGRRIRLFHASADDVNHRVYPEPTDDEFAGMFENTEATGEGETPDVGVYGDIHFAYADERDGRLLLNAGSVGNALDEPTAAYLILEGIPGDDQDVPFQYEIIRAPYDIEAEIAIARKSGMLEAEVYAGELQTAIYRSLQSR